MPARPASPVTLVLECKGQWILWSARGSKGKKDIHGHWDEWPHAIRESLALARRLTRGAELIIHPVPGKPITRTLRFPPR